MSLLSRAEQESLIRWDEDSPTATVYTACARIARRWEKQGIPMQPVGTVASVVISWEGQVPKAAVKVRKVRQGVVVTRKGGKGFRKGGTRHDPS
ncbi:MAG TPA: hypothetical protein VJA25_07675 [Dehalococcoidia bacterium]|nr:hypothetical protein [Dehalococcoidia bacterium]